MGKPAFAQQIPELCLIDSFEHTHVIAPLRISRVKITMQGNTLSVQIFDLKCKHDIKKRQKSNQDRSQRNAVTDVAYLRHIGPYNGDGELFGRLIDKPMKWAEARGLINFN